MLGLTHLALPYYNQVLEVSTEDASGEPSCLNLKVDAAYNLQTIYSTVGNIELADAVTERWLVL